MNEWVAFYKIEPFGEEKADYRNALLCTVIANSNSSKRKFKVTDFMPNYENPKMSMSQMQGALMAHAKRYGTVKNG